MNKNTYEIRNSSKAWNIHTPSYIERALSAFGADNWSEVVKQNLTVKSACKKIDDAREYWDCAIKQRPKMRVDESNIAHIYIFGELLFNPSLCDLIYCGGTDYKELLEDISEAEKRVVKGIFLHIDSPGGMAQGSGEVAQKIANCKIPVFAFSDGLCCSAAYCIACGASYFAATKDALVGSIGTIIPMLDISGFWEEMGIKPDYITNKEGTLKATGYPPSQNPEERAELQKGAEAFFELFKSHVNAHRNLDAEDMRGQAFVGFVAKEKGLIDETAEESVAYEKLKILTN